MTCDLNVGSTLVVADHCSAVCSRMARMQKATTIQESRYVQPDICRDGENLENCERLMQGHQIRRIPTVDERTTSGSSLQADLAERQA